jgi:hypothetical protein
LSQIQGPQYLSDAAKLAQVQSKDSFETKSQVYTNPAAYSYAIGNYLLNWRNEASPVTGFENKLDYIQALLRGSGVSKDTTPRGVIGNDDTKAMQEVSRISLQNGIPFLDTLKELYANKNLNNTVKFSKNIATSIKLLDLTDAKSQLSNAYYQAFGAYPAQAQIQDFQKLWNKEAERQKAQTVTTSTTKGDVTTSLSKSMGEGFTEQEQQQFLANYLVKNFDVATTENLGGQAKSLYDQIVGVHRNNLLAEPDLPAVANVIKDVLKSSDDTVATQKLNDYFAKQRRVASTQYLGVQNQLLAGDDVMTYISPLQEVLRKSFGRTVANNDKLIVSALNYKDDKGNYRPMNEIELNNLIMNDPRYATSPMAISEAASIGDRLTQKLGR